MTAPQTSRITLAAGCFWCTEAVFVRVRGINRVEPGYANGHHSQRPSYEDVCTGQTGYAEVVRVHFDPAIISLEEVLEVFFATHDPTTLNRQGADVGTQYRSGIYVEDDYQRSIALAMIDKLNASGKFSNPIVTEVEPLTHYWPAEDYHRNYYAQNPYQGYCAYVIEPKLQKFMRTMPSYLNTQKQQGQD